MSELDMRSAADFSVARGRAFVNQVMAALSGHSRRLLAYEEVREKLRLGGPIYRGVQAVPLDKVIGSLNRYRDFDRFFAPLQSHTRDRWRKINRVWYEEGNLPPVLLYKVGEVYFVVDGNHRVSVARSKGQVYIDAEVREAVTRVPLTSEVDSEDLQRLGEEADFLERTRLDRLQPGVDIETTVLGGYDRLIEHIAVHRYFMGLDEGREISVKEAVEHWFDTLYRPVVEVIEDSGILEGFPDRTAADLYLWVMDHLHFIKSRTGDTTADAVSAAEDFVHGQREDEA